MQVWTLGLVLLLVGQVIAQARGSRRYQPQPQGNEEQEVHFESRNNGRRAQDESFTGRQPGRRGEATRQDAGSNRSRHEARQPVSRQPEATRQVPSVKEGRRETHRDIQRDEVYRTETPELVRHQPRYSEPKQEQESRQGRGRFSSRYVESSEVTKNPSERTGRQRKFEDRIPPKTSEEESSTERVFLSRNNNPRQPQRSRSEDPPRFKSREETDDVSNRPRGRERNNERSRSPSRQPSLGRQESREDARAPERARSPAIEVKTNHRFQSRGNDRNSQTTTTTTPERRAPRPRPIPPPAEDSSEILQADSLGSPTRQAYRPRQPTLALKPKPEVKTSARVTSTQDRGSAKGPTLNVKTTNDEVLEEDNYPAVYKQLKKQGKPPQEILALLKSQKHKVQEAESISNNIISPPPSTTPSQERNDLFASNERLIVQPIPSTPTVGNLNEKDTRVETVQPTIPSPKGPRAEKFFPGRNNRPTGLRPTPASLREKPLPLIEEPLDVQQVYQKVNEKYSRDPSRNNGAFKNGRSRERFDSKAEGSQSKDIQAEQMVKVPYGINKGQVRKEKVPLPKLNLAGQDEATFSRRDDRINGGLTRPSSRNNGIAYPKRKETVNKYAETLSSDELLSIRRPPASRSGLPNRRKGFSTEANFASRESVEDINLSAKEETITEDYQPKVEQELTSRKAYKQESFLPRTDSKNEVITSSELNTNNELSLDRSEEERQDSKEEPKKSNNLAPKDSVYSWIIESENAHTTEKVRFIPQTQRKYSARISEKSESVTEPTGMKPRYELYQRNKNNILSRKVTPTSGPEDSNKASEEEVNVSNKYFNRPRPTFIPGKKSGKYNPTPLSAVPRFRARKAAENRPSRRNVENNSAESKMETNIEEKNQSSEKKSSFAKESHIQKVPNKYKLNVSTKASIGRRTAGTTEGPVTSQNESLEETTTVKNDAEIEEESDASEEIDNDEEENENDEDNDEEEEEDEEENDESEESSTDSPDNDAEVGSGRSNDSSNENQEVTTEKNEDEEENTTEKEDEENEEDEEEMNENTEQDENDETNDEEKENEMNENTEQDENDETNDEKKENETKDEEAPTESSIQRDENETNDEEREDEAKDEEAATESNSKDDENETNDEEQEDEAKNEDIEEEEETTDENEENEAPTEEAEDVTESTNEENDDVRSENNESEPENGDGSAEDEEDSEDTDSNNDEEETTETDNDVTTESTEKESSNEESNETSDNDNKTENPAKDESGDEENKETEEVTESSTEKAEESENESSDEKNASQTSESTTKESDAEEKINDIESTNKDSENEIDDNPDDLGTRVGTSDDDDADDDDNKAEVTTTTSTTTSESSMQRMGDNDITTAEPKITLGAPSNINDLPTTTAVAITPPTFRTTPNSPTPHFSWGGGCCSSSVIIVTPGSPTPTTPVSRTSLLSSLGFAVDKLTSGTYFGLTTPLPSPNSIPTRNSYPTKLKNSRFIYALTPDNRVVRKIVHTTEAPKDVPFIIFGLYPNGTIIRRFPNGTAVPEEMTEANEVIGTIPNPKYTKEHLEYIIQRDKSLAYLYPDRYLSTSTISNQISTTARQGRTESFIQRIGASTHSIGVVDTSLISTTTTEPSSTSEETLLRIQQGETTPLEEPSTTADEESATTTDAAETTTTTTEKTTTTSTEATTTTTTTTTATSTTVRATTKKSKKKNGRKSSNKRTSKKNKTSTTTTKKPEASTTEATTTPSTTTTTTEQPTTTPVATTTTTTEATTTMLVTTTEEATTTPTTTTTTQGTTTSSTEATTTAKKSEKQSVSTAAPRSGSRKSSKKPKGTTRTNSNRSNNGSRKPKTSSKKSKTTRKPTTTTTTPTTTISLAPPVPAIVSTTATPILATTEKSKSSTIIPKDDPITIDPEIRNRLSDIEILNNFLKNEGAGDMPNADLAQKVIQLAIERAQKTSTVTPQYDNIQALASSTSANKVGVTGSPLDKTTGGKISVWVVPPEGEGSSGSGSGNSLSDAEVERLNQLLASPSTVEGLSPNEQLIVADILSSTGNPLEYSSTRNSKQFPSSTRSPFLQAFFPEQGRPFFGGSLLRTPHYGPADQASKQVEEESGLVQSAINITKAVSQFMSFVVQGAVQNFQNYVSTRTQALARYLSSTPPRQ